VYCEFIRTSLLREHFVNEAREKKNDYDITLMYLSKLTLLSPGIDVFLITMSVVMRMFTAMPR